MDTQPAFKTKALKILIAEDEGDICFLLNLMLKKDNVEIDHVNTIAQARVFLKEEVPDLVIMDNKLPDGQGMNYLPELKKDNPAVKVIMISGHSSHADREKALKMGADIFIGKPFTKEQMQNALKELSSYTPA